MTDARELPVRKSADLILNALKSNQVIIVESPTGSGKTTQIPLILMESGYSDYGIIGITQPRRIATVGVCSYINNQLEVLNKDPSFCAYKMRFYDTTTEKTRIKILTDGMLLQEIKADKMLSDYSVIMVDEAHERSLNIDFILGLLKEICTQRKDLKVIVSSATINTKVFSDFFEENGIKAPVISISTKQYNVDIKYYPVKDHSDVNELSTSICQILNVLLNKFKKTDFTDNEDTLVFLPGESEIKKVLQDIYQYCDYRHLQIYPLYGRLNKEEQEQVFEQTENGKMKVVLATNIAETSLTIDGIKVVIDSGLAKINTYNQRNFTSSLVSRPISKASAMQRSGRAGRTSDGVCYRLYSKEDFNSRFDYTREEILRTDLSEVVLKMVDLGITDFEDFPFITKPKREALESGELTLKMLEAIDENRMLTSIGRLMTMFPLIPRHARCIVEALNSYPEVVENICICVSFLSCKTPFVLPPGEEDQARNCHRRFSSKYGDFIAYQNIFSKYCSLPESKKEDFCNSNYLDKQSMDEIVNVKNQLCQIVRDIGFSIPEKNTFDEDSTVSKCLICLGKGLIQYVCINKNKFQYKTITTDEIYIHPGSSYFRNPPVFLLAGEIVLTTRMYARTVSPLTSDIVKSISPALSKRLLKKADVKSKFTNEKHLRNIKEEFTVNSKTVSIYGLTFPVVPAVKKHELPVALIDYPSLPKLVKAYKNASRHPKQILGCIVFRKYKLFYGSTFYDIVNLSKKINFDDSTIVSSVKYKVYFPDNVNELIPMLDNLMKLTPLDKYPDRLAFIELITTGRGVMLHANPSFTDAINNTSYSLLTIMDENDAKQFSRAYNRVVRLLD